MLEGIAKKGFISIAGATLTILAGAIFILLGIDPSQSLADLISQIIDVSIPVWMGIPVIQVLVVALGVACFVAIGWLDRKAYREFFIKSPPRDMPIHEAIDYIVNDSNIKIPDNFTDHEHDYVRMQIKDQALSGNCMIWGRKEIKLEPYSVKEFEESYSIISIDELKHIAFNEYVFIPCYDPFNQTDYVDKHFDRQDRYHLFTDVWVNEKNIRTLWPRKNWGRRMKDINKDRITAPISKPTDDDAEQEELRHILGEMRHGSGKT